MGEEYRGFAMGLVGVLITLNRGKKHFSKLGMFSLDSVSKVYIISPHII